MTSPLALSPAARISAQAFGEEGQPLLVIDRALADPALVRAIAAQHTYRPIGPHYPGIRAPVSAAIAMPLVDPLAAMLQHTFALAAPPAFGECFLSLVTHGPLDLAPIQRLPHFDGLASERLAALLYLDPAEVGGTAFYRQRATGFESVTDDRFSRYETALRQGIEDRGLPPAAYIAGDTPLFAQTHVIEGRFNRLVIYRGNLLHCASLPPDFAPASDPQQGRLTLNLFLNC